MGRPPLLNQKRNVGWFLLIRFVDLVKGIYTFYISRNHPSKFLLITFYGISPWGISLRCNMFRKKIDQKNFLIKQQITELYQYISMIVLAVWRPVKYTFALNFPILKPNRLKAIEIDSNGTQSTGQQLFELSLIEQK